MTGVAQAAGWQLLLLFYRAVFLAEVAGEIGIGFSMDIRDKKY
jgi:hypothetical protein